MARDPAQQRRVGRSLVAAAVIVFALAIAFWNGFGDLPPVLRRPIAGALFVGGLIDLGLGILFMRRAAP